MAHLSKSPLSLCAPPPSGPPVTDSSSRRRRPSFRRRATRPIARLTVNVQQTASEWSRTTSQLFETGLFRPLPALPAPSPPPPPPRKPPSFVPRKHKAVAMALPQGPLSPAAVAEVMQCLDGAFGNMWYAVCGLAAMVYYGFDLRPPWQVTLECSLAARDNVRCWAIANGMRPVVPSRAGRSAHPNTTDTGTSARVGDGDGGAATRQEVFILTTPSGADRSIRIKYVPHPRDHDRIWVRPVNAWVLTLPSLADRLAQAYVQSLLLPGPGPVGDHVHSARRQAAYADDMGWLLWRIVGEPQGSPHRLTETRAPHIVDRNFWLPFTLSFPGSAEAFAAAGLRVDDDGGGADVAADPDPYGSYMLRSEASSEPDRNPPPRRRRNRHRKRGSRSSDGSTDLDSFCGRPATSWFASLRGKLLLKMRSMLQRIRR